MISMTGYGYKEFQNEKVHLTLELKSCNNRYLDLAINLPASLLALEGQIRSLIRGTIRRGRVEVYLKMKDLGEDSLVVDEQALKSYAAILRRIHFFPVYNWHWNEFHGCR